MSFLILMSVADIAQSQGMKMGEVIIASNSALKKDVKAEAFQSWFTGEIAPAWNKAKPGASMNLFRADRGDRKGEFLLVCGVTKVTDRSALPAGSPFTEKSLGVAGILGIHYIKIKPERSDDFEKFVVENLHPAVGELLPDMQLLYYKAVAGENAGSYITIFTIASPAARHKYWPEGAPETEILKQAFRPLNGLALELASYLIEGSYLLPDSGGAAAYFESRQWTDFINQGFLN